MPSISEALSELVPNAKWHLVNDDYANIDWHPSNQCKKPTIDEIKQKIAELEKRLAIKVCKQKAKELLAESDWAMLPDVNLANKKDFELYRAELRKLAVDPIANPLLPEKPKAIFE